MMRLAVMRPQDKIDESVALARERGFDPVCASPLRVESNESAELFRFLERLSAGHVDMAVLTSSTGVASLMRLLEAHGGRDVHLPHLLKVQLAAIGPLTAKAMTEEGIPPVLMPSVYSSEGLVSYLSKQDMAGKKITLLRSDHGEPVLREGLLALGAEVDDVVVYRLVPDRSSPALDLLIAASLSGKIDAFAFTSSLSAKTFIEAAESKQPGRIRKVLAQGIVAAMGEPTRRKLEDMGIRVDIVPENATFTSMLQGIMDFKNRP
jgi:uroporphyrinogen-III synthase